MGQRGGSAILNTGHLGTMRVVGGLWNSFHGHPSCLLFPALIAGMQFPALGETAFKESSKQTDLPQFEGPKSHASPANLSAPHKYQARFREAMDRVEPTEWPSRVQKALSHLSTTRMHHKPSPVYMTYIRQRQWAACRRMLHVGSGISLHNLASHQILHTCDVAALRA